MNNKILKPPRDKLINQTTYKYARSVVYLVPLINIRYQVFDHITFFAQRLNCTLAYTQL